MRTSRVVIIPPGSRSPEWPGRTLAHRAASPRHSNCARGVPLRAAPWWQRPGEWVWTIAGRCRADQPRDLGTACHMRRHTRDLRPEPVALGLRDLPESPRHRRLGRAHADDMAGHALGHQSGLGGARRHLGVRHVRARILAWSRGGGKPRLIAWRRRRARVRRREPTNTWSPPSPGVRASRPRTNRARPPPACVR